MWRRRHVSSRFRDLAESLRIPRAASAWRSHGISDVLEPHERRLIASSLATFQLGNNRTDAAAASRETFRRPTPRPALARITELSSARSSATRHFSGLHEDHQIALKRTDWTDRVFRLLRRLAGLELYLYILISAELIGIVYYRALEATTDCRRLKMLCRVLVAMNLPTSASSHSCCSGCGRTGRARCGP